jgi:hypothetical protein
MSQRARLTEVFANYSELIATWTPCTVLRFSLQKFLCVDTHRSFLLHEFLVQQDSQTTQSFSLQKLQLFRVSLYKNTYNTLLAAEITYCSRLWVCIYKFKYIYTVSRSEAICHAIAGSGAKKVNFVDAGLFFPIVFPI